MDSFRTASSGQADRLRQQAPYLLTIFLLAVAVYGRTLSFDFLTNWDDPQYITQNQLVREFSFGNVIKIFTRTWSGNYAPLQILSYMFDHALWGMNALGFHLTALLLHAANGVLVHLLVARCSGKKAAGLIAGLLFVVHPVQVESVAWLSQRKNLLALLFFLTAFLLYGQPSTETKNSRMRLAFSFAAFVAALLSKSVAIVLPLCLAVYEITINGAVLDKARTKKLVPYIVAAGTIALLTMYLQKPEMGGGRTVYYGGSLWATMLTMLPVFVRYLGMVVWPSGLCAFYMPPVKTSPDLEVFGAALVLAGVAAAGIALYRRQRPLFFWYCLFFIPLIPVSQIVPLVTLMNDRYLYFPMLGAAGLAGQAFVLLDNAPFNRQKILPRIVLTGIIIALGTASFHRTEAWRNSVNLWSDAVRRHPGSLDLMSALADSYKGAGRTAEAVAAYRTTFAMPGEFIEPRQERGALQDAALLFMNIGSFAEAESLLVRLTTRFPGDAPAFATLADCLSTTGKVGAAEKAYLQALKLDPGSAQAMIGLASLLLDGNQVERAKELLARTTGLGMDGPDLRVALARIAVRHGNRQEALDHLEMAVRQGLFNPARLRLVPDFAAFADDPRFRKLTEYGH